jgi:ribonuclease BN (tRNA processing enzyme)
VFVVLASVAALAATACTAQAPAPDSSVPAEIPGAAEERPAPPQSGTQVVFLGTGTPLPDPDRAGPSTAVVVNGSAYLFDAGPGVVRRAMEARRRGIAALDSVNLRTAFLTHLHSDHTMGLPDLMLTPWVMGRTEPLELYGPEGTRAMTDGILTAWAQDIDRRLNDLQPATPRGWQVNVHEIEPGVVYTDDNVTVTAISVPHGVWTAFGYHVQTADRSIVISGDARPSEALRDACNRCDLFIYEVYTMGSTEKVTAQWQAYRRAYHTSTRELADLAAVSQPDLLVLYHRANPGCDQVGTTCGDSGSEEEALAEMRRFYSGKVVEAHDLDVF